MQNPPGRGVEKKIKFPVPVGITGNFIAAIMRERAGGQR
jgi:hypothetical protein